MCIPASNTKIVFFAEPASLKNFMVRLFTKCDFHHIGFLQWDTMEFFDMFYMRRKRTWVEVMQDEKHSEMVFAIVDSPVEIPTAYFRMKILDQNERYGVKDFLLFAIRPFYHLIGKTTRNRRGLICSEMVNRDLGVHDPEHRKWSCHHEEVDSPCDIWGHLKKIGSRVQWAFGDRITTSQKNEFRKHGLKT